MGRPLDINSLKINDTNVRLDMVMLGCLYCMNYARNVYLNKYKNK